ncbi:MAG TPA: NADH-quinone oxidoreductase subunit C [Candidatus Saccharimonadales bacterium]|nr:NADH-quinone oxidoreductase subunit C [Candidatus Saccharimonadales bacterium]
MIRVADGIPTGTVRPDQLHRAIDALLTEGFDYLVDLFAYDTPERQERFDVVYLLHRMSDGARTRLKVQVADGDPVPTITDLYPNADWYEREVFDLYGVPFTGHPDLRRILLPDDWIGHPLRRDHPLGGEVVDYGLRAERRDTVAPLVFPEGTGR